MGTGLHGTNGGAIPAALTKIVKMYVLLTRLMHGLKATVLCPKELRPLYVHYKDLLCPIKGHGGHLSPIYPPLSLMVIHHVRMLGLYGSICQLDDDYSQGHQDDKPALRRISKTTGGQNCK